MDQQGAWPPTVVQSADWDNGGGVAVMCGEHRHRVVRRGDDVVALDHSGIDDQVKQARTRLARNDIALLGYRYVDWNFLFEDLTRWREQRTWTSIRYEGFHPEADGAVPDPAGLAPCVRLILEGFVPCMWCGDLLANGNYCSPYDNQTCALSSGNGWKKAIPPGWVQGTQIGSPHGLSTVAWPVRYRWIRSGPFTHHPQVFLSSPWWPDVHPRRLKNLVCQYAADHAVATPAAFQAVAAELTRTFGPMRPPPPTTDFTFHH